jgi:hypothetical protein
MDFAVVSVPSKDEQDHDVHQLLFKVSSFQASVFSASCQDLHDVPFDLHIIFIEQLYLPFISLLWCVCYMY